MAEQRSPKPLMVVRLYLALPHSVHFVHECGKHMIEVENESWPANMYYFYILRSEVNKKLYLGYTNDLKKRLSSHNSKANNASKPYAPYELLYYSAFKNQKDALGCEKYFKTTAGWKRMKRMLKNTLLF